MGRQRTVARVEEEWRALMAAVDGLPAGAFTRPGVAGEWSVRDILGHITSWEREFLRALPVILAGERLPHYSTLYGGIDAFNADEQARTRALSLPEVRRRLAGTHAELMTTLVKLPDQDAGVETRLRRRLRQDTYHHYRLHADQVRGRTAG